MHRPPLRQDLKPQGAGGEPTSCLQAASSRRAAHKQDKYRLRPPTVPQMNVLLHRMGNGEGPLPWAVL